MRGFRTEKPDALAAAGLSIGRTLVYEHGALRPDYLEGQGAGAITFYGSSFVCDARGDKLAELARGATGAAIATLDTDELRRVRASMGFFRDRRPELYGPLVR